jgi:hypothetical protein
LGFLLVVDERRAAVVEVDVLKKEEPFKKRHVRRKGQLVALNGVNFLPLLCGHRPTHKVEAVANPLDSVDLPVGIVNL